MKINPHRTAAESALTLVEVAVILTLVVILFVILDLIPYSDVHRITSNLNALSNARQIGIALRLYANDHDGKFPSFTLKNGEPTTTPVSDSNTAFAQLFPQYASEEKIFWLPKSAFCNTNPPDEITDKQPLDTPLKTLEPGENEWAYVLSLKDDSNPDLPLLADGFANVTNHTYVNDPAKKGGVWKGRKAIVIHVDGSGVVASVDQPSMTVSGSNGGISPGDIFTTANGSKGWLGPANVVVNPK